ncbi:MAG: M16 family metallopeptidase [Actinomycetota bacterium]
MSYERTVLPSGIRVLSEIVPGQHSVSVGAWLGTGSRDESPDVAGVTHFLEHLVFKGTPARSALQIAEEFDAIGGDINAFTTKEFICFHSRALGADLPLCVDVTADIISNARLDGDDVESERTVVLEEIAMHEDTPDDHVFDVFGELVWAGDPLGRPVQGTHGSIEGMPVERIASHYGSRFPSSELVVTAAGDVDHGSFVELVARAFGDDGVGRGAAVRAHPVVVSGALGVRERDIEQAHVVFGGAGIARGDPRRWALEVLNVAFGGGMSSRLSQEVREKRGLVYSIWSGSSMLADTGTFTVYAGCSPERLREVLSIVREQSELILRDGITQAERDRAVGHLRGSLLLSLDDPGARMSHLGKSELLLGEVPTAEEMIARVEAVTLDDVRAIAHEVLGTPWSLALLGPVSEGDVRDFVGAAA